MRTLARWKTSKTRCQCLGQKNTNLPSSTTRELVQLPSILAPHLSRPWLPYILSRHRVFAFRSVALMREAVKAPGAPNASTISQWVKGGKRGLTPDHTALSYPVYVQSFVVDRLGLPCRHGRPSDYHKGGPHIGIHGCDPVLQRPARGSECHTPDADHY